MTDAILSQPVTLNRPDGSSLTFKKCSPADRIALRAIFRQYRKVWLAGSLQVLGISGDAAVEHFNRLDRARLYESDVNRWLNEPEGQNEAVLMSLRKDTPQAEMVDVYALELSPDESLTVAAGVFNVPIIDPAKAGPERPLPTGIGTTDATATLSAGSLAAPIPSPSPLTSLTDSSPTPTTSAA